ncbi:MAG: hypothetical protein LBH80_01520 [Prevotellaceae bacterium]|nr:hypothetical protein [Prevotellaceae bacterium]
MGSIIKASEQQIGQEGNETVFFLLSFFEPQAIRNKRTPFLSPRRRTDSPQTKSTVESRCQKKALGDKKQKVKNPYLYALY